MRNQIVIRALQFHAHGRAGAALGIMRTIGHRGVSLYLRLQQGNMLETGLAFQQQFPQHDRVVTHLVMSRIDQRDRTLSRKRTQLGQQLSIPVQLLGVTTTELVPAGRVVPESLP